MEKNKQEIINIKSELDALLGDEPNELLKDVLQALGNSDASAIAEVKEAVVKLSKVSEGLQKVIPAISQLEKAIETLKLDVPKELDVFVKNLGNTPTEKTVKVDNLKEIEFPKKIKVENIKDAQAKSVKVDNLDEIHIPEPKEEVRISNLKDIVIPPLPSETKLTKPNWWKDPVTLKEMSDFMEGVKDIFLKVGVKQNLDEYREPSRPIAVRLSNGRKFIDNLVTAISQGGTTAFPFENAEGKATAPIVNPDGSLSISSKPRTDFEGGQVTVGTTEVEITFSGTTHTIKISADVNNTGFVYIGKTGVTTTTAMEQLEPGSSITIELNDSSNALYAISDTAGQTIRKMALIQ